MPSEITPASLPDIDPNEREVAFVALECRTCGEHGPWVRHENRTEDPGAAWDVSHANEAGHTKFYMWTVKRNTAEMWTLPRRKRGRK